MYIPWFRENVLETALRHVTENRIINDIIEENEHRVSLETILHSQAKKVKNFVIIRGGKNNES